jgi:hypothetical protein
MILQVVLIILSALLLAAHFFRQWAYFLCAISLLAPLLLLVRRRWALLVLQLLAYAGALVWITTMLRIVQERRIEGRRWIGVVIILGTVSLVTLLSGALLNAGRVRSRYTGGRGAANG